ncbi:MAG: hypothetical protein ACLTA5_09435 [Anaerococcus obesiensis]
MLECTGFFTEKRKSRSTHQSWSKVLISAPGKGDLKTIVFGVNHEILDG